MTKSRIDVAPIAMVGLLLLGCPQDSAPGEQTPADGGIGEVGGDDGGSGDDGDDGGTGDDGSTDGDATGADDGTAGMVDESGTTGEPTDDDTFNDGGEPELMFLTMDPPESIIELDINEMGSVAFTVTGHYDNGDEIDVTDQIDAWTVSNPTVGAMNGTALAMGGFGTSFFDSTIVNVTLGDDEGNAQVTVAAYQQTGPEQDFFFVLPFEDRAGTQDKPLEFSTDVKSLDVFFNMDTTGSMEGPITNLQASLVSTVIPTIEAEVADTQFGAGAFEDFPWGGFGETTCDYFQLSDPDQPFELLQEITNSAPNVQAAVNALSLPGGEPIGCGNDGPESNIEALYQIATGEGLNAPGITNVAANANGVGGVAFREGTMPIIVSITDAVSHENAAMCQGSSYSGDGSVAAVAHDRAQMYDALDAICARVVPVAVGNFSATCGPLADGTEFATNSGAVIPPEAWDELVGGRPPGCAVGTCCTGVNGAGVAVDAGTGLCPLVYRVNSTGTGLDDTVVDGVQMLARYAPFTVSTAVDGVAQDQDGAATPVGTTSADFIVAVTPFGHGPVPVQGVPDPVLTPTTFEGVVPDTDVSFTVEAFNDFVPQGAQPRLFVATIRVLADGCSDLDEREVFILVPPQELPAPG